MIYLNVGEMCFIPMKCQKCSPSQMVCMNVCACWKLEFIQYFGTTYATSRKLQDSKLDLNAAVAMVVSLKRATRETFTEYEQHGATLSGTSDYVQTRQHPRNVRFDYGPASDAELTPSQKFRVTSYIPVIDQFVVSLAHRLSAYEELQVYVPYSVSLGNVRVLVHWRSKVQQIISSLSTKTT